MAGCFRPRPGLDFKQSSLDHAARVWRGERPAGGPPPASPAGSVPLRLSPSGHSDDPGASLRAPPDCVRDSTPRSAAHAFDVIRLSSHFLPRSLRPWMMPRTVSASRISRTSSVLDFEVTCLPSPCGRLSRPPTTLETPLPWGSPPEGQSRAALTRHVLARFRSSTHPYARARCPMSLSRATTRRLPDLVVESRHVNQLCSGVSCTPTRIGLQAIQP